MKRRKDGAPVAGDEMPLHVLIESWNDKEKLDRAVEKVTALLVPQTDEEHQKAMKELAVLNGTFRDTPNSVICQNCGKTGHTMYKCPNREVGWKSANVRCAVCGGTTHVTADCRVRTAAAGGPPVMHAQLNNEYDSFMKEIGAEDRDGAAGPPPPGSIPPQANGAPHPVPSQSAFP